MKNMRELKGIKIRKKGEIHPTCKKKSLKRNGPKVEKK